MRKIVINACFGGFSLSKECALFCGAKVYEDKKFTFTFNSHGRDIKRDNPKLVEFIETFGSERASGKYAGLKIVEIPDDVEWQIEEYDGNEHIAEVHRTWS